MDETYLDSAPDWYSQWVQSVHAKGGVATRMPPGRSYTLGVDDQGQLAERYPDGNGGYNYVLAPAAVRVMDTADSSVADAYLQFEAGFSLVNGDGALQSIANLPASVTTAVADAATGAAKKVPWWVWVAGAVVAYGALVQAGILPPVNKLVK